MRNRVNFFHVIFDKLVTSFPVHLRRNKHLFSGYKLQFFRCVNPSPLSALVSFSIKLGEIE